MITTHQHLTYIFSSFISVRILKMFLCSSTLNSILKIKWNVWSVWFIMKHSAHLPQLHSLDVEHLQYFFKCLCSHTLCPTINVLSQLIGKREGKEKRSGWIIRNDLCTQLSRDTTQICLDLIGILAPNANNRQTSFQFYVSSTEQCCI